MYHINSLVDDRQRVAVWPFHGRDAARDEVYDLPLRFVFHLELFHVAPDHAPQLDNAQGRSKTPYFALCEIEGRHPSASVPNLIELMIGTSFAQVEFRFGAGLEYVVPLIPTGPRVGDLFIPLRANCTVVTMPAPATFPISKLKYVPLARSGLVYLGYDADTLCMAAWMLATGGSSKSIVQRLFDAERWFTRHVVYVSLDDDAKTAQERR
ncbi:hypothetical protein GGF31_007667 [Allomyces arbusculus]|nr:hypothetical protein GGF31_007667 [Allomyces arbusculus]